MTFRLIKTTSRLGIMESIVTGNIFRNCLSKITTFVKMNSFYMFQYQIWTSWWSEHLCSLANHHSQMCKNGLARNKKQCHVKIVKLYSQIHYVRKTSSLTILEVIRDHMSHSGGLTVWVRRVLISVDLLSQNWVNGNLK